MPCSPPPGDGCLPSRSAQNPPVQEVWEFILHSGHCKKSITAKQQLFYERLEVISLNMFPRSWKRVLFLVKKKKSGITNWEESFNSDKDQKVLEHPTEPIHKLHSMVTLQLHWGFFFLQPHSARLLYVTILLKLLYINTDIQNPFWSSLFNSFLVTTAKRCHVSIKV